MTSPTYTRREMLALTGRAALAGALAPRFAWAAATSSPAAAGTVVGDSVAAKVGLRVLQDGGNAIDAAIAAAFAAGICTPRNCGVGGYGGHAVIALAGGKKITTIDFNSMAPAAARADMFPLDAKGAVIGGVNTLGWLAAGVPGTLAGLDLALQRYGTRSLRDTLAPAIAMCESGTHAIAVKGIDDVPADRPPVDGGSAGGALLPQQQRNLALAGLLKTLAARNSTESFYRGDLAEKIAEGFQRNGGLVTRADLAAYRAREAAPLTLEWNGMTLHTAPLTATGLLVLEACAILKALDWPRLSAPQRRHARLEALRIAWVDRARTFGDPDHVAVPIAELISRTYTGAMAEKVSVALKAEQPVRLNVNPSQAGGTTNLSAADRHGNLIAITLTHGGAFGAKVVVPELGVVLGHGMSRFDPRPGLPNSPGPRKRPINNMCPTIVTRGGVPVFAVGGAGGTRIPNGLYEVLLNYVGLGASLDSAMNAPRVHTDGTLKVGLDKQHTPDDEAFFKRLGYQTSRVAGANISAVSFDPTTGQSRGITNGTV